MTVSPWITNNFSKNRIKANFTRPCENYKGTFVPESSEFKSAYSKTAFGASYDVYIYCPGNQSTPIRKTYFVTFLGTVHSMGESKLTGLLKAFVKNPALPEVAGSKTIQKQRR